MLNIIEKYECLRQFSITINNFNSFTVRTKKKKLKGNKRFNLKQY